MKLPPSVTLPQDRVPLFQKLCYGAGAVSGQFTGSITTQMINPVFNIVLGLNPALVGLATMVFRIWDSLTDVVMGNISDNTRTPLGRRRPYIIVGSVLSGFALPIFWQVSAHWSHRTIYMYMIGTGLLLYTLESVWAMPYYSMGMEMSPDYDERTRVTAYRAVFEKFSGIFAGWLLALVSIPYFGLTAAGGADVAHGMRVVSWGMGGLMILFGILPGLFVKERYYQDAKNQPRMNLLRGFKTTFQCRPFMLLMPVYVLQVIGAQMVGSLGLYLNIYYINGGDIHEAGIIQGWKMTAMYLPGILTIPFWAWLAAKIGKRHALGWTIALGYVTNVMVYFCYTPKHPYLQILPAIFLASFGSSIWMLVPSMQADIADYDELHSGERREGSYSSISSWFFKLAVTLTSGGSGLILTWTGFDVVKFGNHQPPEVLHRMLMWYIFIPMFFWTVALIVLTRYPLTREAVADIRAQLEQRRGKL